MKSLAAAIVVFAGALLWGLGTLCETWTYLGGGNLWPGTFASYGGIAIAAVGGLFLLRAFKSPEE